MECVLLRPHLKLSDSNIHESILSLFCLSSIYSFVQALIESECPVKADCPNFELVTINDQF